MQTTAAPAETHPEAQGITCNESCQFAEGPECTCSCGGRHHGKGVIVRTTQRHGVTYRLAAFGWAPEMASKARTIPGSFVESVTRKHAGWTELQATFRRGAQQQALLFVPVSSESRKAA